MPRAFSWLPYVDNCCACTYNLRAAVMSITVFAVIHSFSAISHILLPMCKDIHGKTGFGLVIFIFDGISCATGSFMFLATILMAFTSVINNPIVKPFIITTFMTTFTDVILAVLYLIRMASLNYICEHDEMSSRIYKKSHVHPYWLVLQIFMTIINAAAMIYYTIVANSFAKQWDDYDGNIPMPPDDVPLQPVPPKGQPYKPYL